jgi:hypothetical protein
VRWLRAEFVTAIGRDDIARSDIRGDDIDDSYGKRSSGTGHAIERCCNALIGEARLANRRFHAHRP